MQIRVVLLGLFFAASIGCVSKSTHQSKVAELDEKIKVSEDLLAKKNAQIQELEAKLISTAKDKGQLKASLDEMTQAMNEMRERREEQQKRLAEFKDLSNRFKSLTDSGALSVKVANGKMIVQLGSDVLFPSGSSRLSAQGKQTIEEISKTLAQIPEKSYQVEGHTDNVPISTAQFPSNWELASSRAINVMKTMIDVGLSPTRVSAASYGETSPIQSNETAEGKAQNRRIEIAIVPDLSSLPGYEELQKMATIQ